MTISRRTDQDARVRARRAACIGLFVACGLWSADHCIAQGHGPSRVEVALVEQREVAPTMKLVGTVRPRIRTTVAAQVSGLVAAIPIDEGDRVATGQLLCKLRAEQRRLAHEEAVARQAELKAVLAERNAELGKAEYEAERTARLWEERRCSDKERRDAQADHAAAKGRVAQARHAESAQDAVVRALADDLAQTQIRAPCDGFIVAKETEVGSWVSEGGGIVTLIDLSTVRVRVLVPESMIEFCRVGTTVQISVEALKEDFAGKISRLIPDGDARARTFPVEIDIPNPKSRLKAGMFVRAAMPSGPRSTRLVIPKDAVVLRGPMAMVHVVRDSDEGQMAMPVPVRIVSEVVDHVAVEAEGLSAGDQVIVRGNEFMFGPGPVIAVPWAEQLAADSKMTPLPASQPVPEE